MNVLLLLFPSLLLPRGGSQNGETNKAGTGHISCNIYCTLNVFCMYFVCILQPMNVDVSP